MTKKAIITIFFLSLLATIACASADYAAMAHIEYGTVTPGNAPLSAEAQSEATQSIQATATNSPSWQVCTGVEDGTLRVRNAPGVDGKVILTLSEEQNIFLPAVPETQETNDGATWIEIADPEGWINARYICEDKQ